MLFFDNEDKNTNFFPHRRITERAKRMFFCAMSKVYGSAGWKILAHKRFVWGIFPIFVRELIDKLLSPPSKKSRVKILFKKLIIVYVSNYLSKYRSF
ncbi:hypothetical protein HQ46_08720 [Porphyromonas gulae]|nr:hypothetical protein HQ46_08720 [Porphyromonas gulae]